MDIMKSVAKITKSVKFPVYRHNLTQYLHDFLFSFSFMDRRG